MAVNLTNSNDIEISKTGDDIQLDFSTDRVNQLDRIEDTLANIVETGGSSSGNYIKFSNGVMICYGKKTVSTGSWAQWGNAVNWDESNVLSFPHTFDNAISCTTTICGSFAASIVRTQFDNNGITQITFSRASGANNSDMIFSYIAIGTWQ